MLLHIHTRAHACIHQTNQIHCNMTDSVDNDHFSVESNVFCFNGNGNLAEQRHDQRRSLARCGSFNRYEMYE